MLTLKTRMLKACQNKLYSQDFGVTSWVSRVSCETTIFIFLAVLFGCFSLYLGQDINWDLLNYHYYNGFAAIHHRHAMDIAPALMQTYLNPLFDLWNYAILSLPSAKVAVFVLGMHSAVIGVVLYKIADLLFVHSRWNTIVALVIGMSGAASVSLLGTTTNDQYSALLVLLAFYLLLSALFSLSEWRIALSGWLVGIAIGGKLTAACYFVGLVVSVFCAAPLFYKRKWIALFSVFALFGFVLINGYWMVHLYQQFQNPFFPYYNNIFHSSFAPYMSFNLPPAAAKPSWMQIIFMPVYVAFSQSLIYAERIIQDSRFLTVVILGALYFMKGASSSQPQAWKLLIGFFVASYLAWVFMFAVYRYALPLEYLTGILIVYFVQGLMRETKWRIGFLLLLLCYFALTTHYPNWGRMKVGSRYFAIDTPSVLPHSTIMIASVPLAYVIPSFPHDTRFVGMTFISLGENISASQKMPHRRMLASVMKQFIENPNRSPLYSLTILRTGASGYLTIDQTERNNKRSFAILKHFGWQRDERNCVSFDTNVGDKLQLCPLKYH